MRKKFLAVMIVAVVAVCASYNIYQSQNTNTLSDLALANVEALASGEGSGVKCCPDTGDQCTLSSGDILADQDECPK